MHALFTLQDDGLWQPDAHARGPFDGLQGGALSALMCGLAEQDVPEGMTVVAVHTQFLRPCPLAPITLAVRTVQHGGRLAVMHVDLSSEGKLRATASVTAMRQTSIAGLADLHREEHRPWDGQLRQRPAVHGRPWLMDKMETRTDAANAPWFKFDMAVIGTESAFVRSVCAADWLPGVTRPDSWDKPLVAGSPNVDLTVRMVRAPNGSWTGIRAKGLWAATGHGIAQGELLDVDGVFGSVSCTVALIALS